MIVVRKMEMGMSKQRTITAYKGFDQDMACDGFQYEIGKTYEHEGGVETCASRLHAYEHPLNVLDYYDPASSRFAVVELGGNTVREKENDTEIVVASRISIKAEIELPQLAEAAVRYVFNRAKWVKGSVAKAKNGAATASGRYGAAIASADHSNAMATGLSGKARAKEGCGLYLVERGDDDEILHNWAGIAGRNGIKPDTYYTLKNGKPVEAA